MRHNRTDSVKLFKTKATVEIELHQQLYLIQLLLILLYKGNDSTIIFSILFELGETLNLKQSNVHARTGLFSNSDTIAVMW